MWCCLCPLLSSLMELESVCNLQEMSVVVEADSGLHPRQSAASVRQIGREHECEAEEKKLSMDFRQETPATRACIWKLEKLESKHAEKRANALI